MPSATTTALFTPIKVGQHVLKHRVALAPLTRMRADDNGNPTEQVVEYYKQRATPGGLLITEATAISPYAGAYPHTPGIYTNEHIAAWKKVTDAVHEKEGIIYLQLWHLGRASFSFLLPDNQTPVSASDISIEGTSPLGAPYQKPRPLEVEEIKSITQDFAQAAKNAIAAGFDGIEIHSANGYLLDQFINTSSNKRTDQYGGSIENRARFSLEVVDAVAKAIGDDKTAVRYSPWSGFQDMKDDTPVATWSYITEQLEKTHPDLAYLHFTEPRVTLFGDAPIEVKEGEKVDTLDPFRALWSGPFISAGNYTYDPKSVFERAETSPNNLVAVGRAFIANPDLVERLRNNWKLTPYNRATFYTPGPEGYTDYAFYNQDN
ncbi:uncharacterized protein BX664DRAFT_342485 [Halteromyces radiatus]|uniref:uncharacterized protein n=1 Tax=Halteromyces radiatus TaxID=101107 RepID=UPI00221F735C|nr:uncharacterized protein BX664DRAFT_342485 [Halteromyces radiatus]KAI8078687.1 hypothetical protein BX664DRAFT_342485 [Halteromyces radiatus]